MWLITTFPSCNYDIENYPAIKNHLLSYNIHRLEQSGNKYVIDGKEIKSRKRTNNKWFETQDSINYWDDFNKQKIIYPCIMSKESSFALDSNAEFYTIAPGNIISGKNLKYLLAFLNSKTYYFALRKFYMGGGIEGELKTNRLLLVPIPIPKEKFRLLIESKVDLLLDKYKEINILDKTILDEIEEIIQNYLKLSEEEINIINNTEY